MKLRDALPQLLGKRICGAVVKQGGRSPRMQVFLVFDDDTWYEFYSDEAIHGIGGLNRGNIEHVRRYMPDQSIIFDCDVDGMYFTYELTLDADPT